MKRSAIPAEVLILRIGGVLTLLVSAMFLIMSRINVSIADHLTEHGLPIPVLVDDKQGTESGESASSEAWYVFLVPDRELSAAEQERWDKARVKAQPPNARALRPEMGEAIALHLGPKDDPTLPIGSRHTLLVSSERWGLDRPVWEVTWPSIAGIFVGLGVLLLARRERRRSLATSDASRPPRQSEV